MIKNQKNQFKKRQNQDYIAINGSNKYNIMISNITIIMMSRY